MKLITRRAGGIDPPALVSGFTPVEGGGRGVEEREMWGGVGGGEAHAGAPGEHPSRRSGQKCLGLYPPPLSAPGSRKAMTLSKDTPCSKVTRRSWRPWLPADLAPHSGQPVLP